MRSNKLKITATLLTALLVGGHPASAREIAETAIVDHAMGVPWGEWQGLLNLGHSALKLYRKIESSLPPGDTRTMATSLAAKQEAQNTLLQRLFRDALGDKSTPMTIPDGFPLVPPPKSRWTAHKPPTVADMIRAAKEYENLATDGYAWLDQAVGAHREAPSSTSLTSIQREQLALLNQLSSQVGGD